MNNPQPPEVSTPNSDSRLQSTPQNQTQETAISLYRASQIKYGNRRLRPNGRERSQDGVCVSPIPQSLPSRSPSTIGDHISTRRGPIPNQPATPLLLRSGARVRRASLRAEGARLCAALHVPKCHARRYETPHVTAIWAATCW
eukprot:238678-Rhodomonas_salina.2